MKPLCLPGGGKYYYISDRSLSDLLKSILNHLETQLHVANMQIDVIKYDVIQYADICYACGK